MDGTLVQSTDNYYTKKRCFILKKVSYFKTNMAQFQRFVSKQNFSSPLLIMAIYPPCNEAVARFEDKIEKTIVQNKWSVIV